MSRHPVRALLALVCLAFLLAPPAPADQDDPRLDALFESLAAAPDAATAAALEAEIWRLWTASGRRDVDAIVAAGIGAMVRGDIEQAIAHFDRVVALAPAFAEGWNKRATAYYLNGDLARSVYDIQRTLALEPRHFGAIAGMGLIFLAQGDQAGALDAFEAVLRIHPHSPGARQRVEELRRALEGRGVRAPGIDHTGDPAT